MFVGVALNSEVVPRSAKKPTQRLLPVRFSIFHQHFRTWIITSFTTIQLSVSVTPQAIYINHMAM